MRVRARILAVFLSTTVVIFIISAFSKRQIDDKKRGSKIRTIVAHSLGKQLEVESKVYKCGTFTNVSDGVYHRNEWFKVPNTNFYVFDTYVDDRLHPYNYWRILGMVKGKYYKKQ